MIDELQGKVLREVVCLRLKLYSIDYAGGKKQRAKEVQKSVKKTLSHDLFLRCRLSKENFQKTMTQLRSHWHQTVVNEFDKVALSSFDDKRFLLENGISSFTYGHYKTGANSFESINQQRGLLIFPGCYLKFN